MLMIVLGLIGCAVSTYYQFSAKEHAMKMVGDVPLPDGKSADSHVLREEFEVYDGIKTMAALSFFFFAKLIVIGKCGKKATWKKKSAVTKKMMRNSCIGLLLLVIVAIMWAKEAKHVKHIVKKAHTGQEL